MLLLKEFINKTLNQPKAQGVGMWQLLLAYTKTLEQLYLSSHWQSAGANYYSDHLLYERLYKSVSAEIDGLAEKMVGLYNSSIINPVKIMSLSSGLTKTLWKPEITSSQFPSILCSAEQSYLNLIKLMIEELKKSNQLTNGTENLLQQICDNHESHSYLLKQRLSADAIPTF